MKARSQFLRRCATPTSALLDECQDGAGRFSRDFDTPRVVGSGHFSVVYRARNVLDGQEYAIKKTKEPLARGASRRREMLQEALALASLAIESPSDHVVRYFCSWIEDDRLFIQMELCDGSLKDAALALRASRPHDPRLEDDALAAVIRDVCQGLGVIHGKNLAHLDVKPENILVKRVPSAQGDAAGGEHRIHKIADLGLATAAIGSGCDELSEGDCRYLAREVLQGDFSDLTKADVFALGLLCYELATNPKELPCNGDEWHRLRDGHLERSFCDQLSAGMMALVASMVHPVAAERPPCAEVLKELDISSQQGQSGAVVEELQEELSRKTEAVELERQRRASAEAKAARAEERLGETEEKLGQAEEKADRYWSELLHLKRQEMLRDSAGVAASLGGGAAAAASQQLCALRRSLTA